MSWCDLSSLCLKATNSRTYHKHQRDTNISLDIHLKWISSASMKQINYNAAFLPWYMFHDCKPVWLTLQLLADNHHETWQFLGALYLEHPIQGSWQGSARCGVTSTPKEYTWHPKFWICMYNICINLRQTNLSIESNIKLLHKYKPCGHNKVDWCLLSRYYALITKKSLHNQVRLRITFPKQDWWLREMCTDSQEGICGVGETCMSQTISNNNSNI
jgi:hypothetical protein